MEGKLAKTTVKLNKNVSRVMNEIKSETWYEMISGSYDHAARMALNRNLNEIFRDK